MRLNQKFLLACSALLVGCASGPSDTEQEVTISANTDRAMVEIDGVRVGRTPIRVVLDRTRNHQLLVGKSGYEVYETVLRPTLVGSDYGFTESIKVNLAEAGESAAATKDIPEEDMAEFKRAKSVADAPFGVDAAIYGTLAGDLAEAKASSQRLAEIAADAHKRLVESEERLAKAVEKAKAQSESGETQAVAKLEDSEKALRAALAAAQEAEAQAAKAQSVVDQRIAFLRSLQDKGEAAPKEAVEAVAAAKLEVESAERKVVLSQTALTEAAAALNAAAEARAKTAQGVDDDRLQSIANASEASRNSTQEIAAKLELSARVIAARVEELAKESAAGKSENAAAVAAAQAALDAARKENAELAVQLAAAQAENAKAAADNADKALQEANEKAADLERKLAESRLATEAKERENRGRTYAEYTARKGLLERRLRAGELTPETYAGELAALDKELRNR